jgi:hypothetical protein
MAGNLARAARNIIGLAPSQGRSVRAAAAVRARPALHHHGLGRDRLRHGRADPRDLFAAGEHATATDRVLRITASFSAAGTATTRPSSCISAPRSSAPACSPPTPRTAMPSSSSCAPERARRSSRQDAGRYHPHHALRQPHRRPRPTRPRSSSSSPAPTARMRPATSSQPHDGRAAELIDRAKAEGRRRAKRAFFGPRAPIPPRRSQGTVIPRVPPTTWAFPHIPAIPGRPETWPTKPIC